MKKCSQCKEDKPFEKFSKDSKRKDGLQTSCKACQKLLGKKYYDNNKAEVKDTAKQYRAQTRKIIQKLKEIPCKDCGVQYEYYVMQFDHLKDKTFGISWGLMNKSRQDLLEEIKKCEVVCANCHATRTFRRLTESGLIG